MIICIIGPSCAGKTTTAKYLQDKTAGYHYEASEFVRNRYSENSFEGSVMEFVKKEFNTKGKETFAHPICREIKKSDSDLAIISGFRTNEEIKVLQREFGSIKVVGIYANSLLRYQRKLRRDNPDSGYSYREFLEKDFTEYDFGIVKILDKKSDDLIINEGTYDDLYESINEKVLDKTNLLDE